MKYLKIIFCFVIFTVPLGGYSQSKNPNDFPELIFTAIPGAPKLSKPQLLVGEEGPLITEGYGWASPALMDINNDGQLDLLVGEFYSGLENNGKVTGNYLRVYLNTGTSESPEYSNDWFYLKNKHTDFKGNPLSVYQYCCMAFTPRIVDLDNDGYLDIVTGQYDPGIITWFRGTDYDPQSKGMGFLPGVEVEQFGDPKSLDRRVDDFENEKSWPYWVYSAVDFVDLNQNGKYDMIIGGRTALRMSKNIGTKEKPKYDKRIILKDTDGEPLAVPEFKVNMHGERYQTTANCMIPIAVDWDGDGIVDILATHSYVNQSDFAITFFKGVDREEGLVYEKGVPLFTAKNGGKAFPGSYLNVYVADWNNDGVMDLIIGTSVGTSDNEFYPEIAWDWEEELKTVKQNPKYDSKESIQERERLHQLMAERERENKVNGGISYTRSFYADEKFKDREKMAHHGYVYVMLGSN